MSLAGCEKLAHWRETGAWWSGEAPLEVVQWRDVKGVRRESVRELPEVKTEKSTIAWTEDNTVETTLRPRKTRDEKVAKDCQAHAGTVFSPKLVSGSGRSYVPLHIQSGHSFGHSVLLAIEAARTSAIYGCPAAALVDRFSLGGSVEFARECHELGVKALIGASFEMEDGGEVTLIARDKTGYRSLSRLVSECHLGEPRQFPLCTVSRLSRHSRGLLCLTGGDGGRLDRLVLAGQHDAANAWLGTLVSLYGRQNVFVEIERSWLPWGMMVERRLLELSGCHDVVPISGGRVTHSRPEDFPAQDVALCAHSLCLVDEVIGRKPQRDVSQIKVTPWPLRSLNSERYFRRPDEMWSQFHDRPDLVDNTFRVAERCDTDVLPGRTRLPLVTDDSSALLRHVTAEGARRWHGQVTSSLQKRLSHEVERIVRLGYADHFVLAWDMCEWARDNGVQFSGRGSVVDSAVAYCLGISRIDAYRHNLHFDRFLPEDASKRPDIDIDFESKRREDVRQYLVNKYGKDHVATVAAIGAYNTRGIVREVGKALGLCDEVIGQVAKKIHGGIVPEQLENALEKRPELRDSNIDRERLYWLFALAGRLADVPRNIRAHSSGVVVSADPIAETVPVMLSGEDGVRIIQWDKRSAKHYFDKFDILCLRGQDVLSGTERRVRKGSMDGSETFDVQAVPVEHVENFRAMKAGELIGVPQSASPAMRQAHMRLQTENLHDASLVQAGIRPGVGGAVKLNELIARRRGVKPFDFAHPDFEPILGLTYGIVVFQEQIDQLLSTFAGYGSGEAEDIRDAIHKRRREDYGQVIKEELIARVVSRGYTDTVAQQVFDFVAGFKGYGFAQGHALAFSDISLRSIYCQQNYPAEYFASLLDAQPAGYYGPCTLVNEARYRGVKILPVDINESSDCHSVEDVSVTLDNGRTLVVPNGGIRLPLSTIDLLHKQTVKDLMLSRQAEGPFLTFHDFVRRVTVARHELENLVIVGAFDSLCPHRRALLWAVPQALSWAKTLKEGLFEDCSPPHVDHSIPDFSLAERCVRERRLLGLDVAAHLMAFERGNVASRGGITCREAQKLISGRRAIVVGNPIRLRFPPTPSGKRVVFFDLEDETGLLNVTCFDRVYQRDGHAIVTSPYVTLIGTSQWRDGHSAFIVSRAFPYTPAITKMVDNPEKIPVKTADFLVG